MSYLNTKPLIYGFEKGMMAGQLELITDYPANIADMLIKGTVDISLLPVAVMPLLKEYHIISDYCIGSEGEVGSVCLFSDVPLEGIKSILIDYQSRTSAELLKILLRDLWQINPELIAGEEGYENKIKGNTAGLIIGDRAFIQAKKSKYSYDLGKAWQELTGLPFVFAAWVTTKVLPENFLNDFNKATGEGFRHMPEIIAANHNDHFDLQKYYTDNISYKLDGNKRRGMEEFLKRCMGRKINFTVIISLTASFSSFFLQ